MGDFIDTARRLSSDPQAQPNLTHFHSFSRVFEAVALLQRVHSKSEFDIENIESIYTALEMAATIGAFPEKNEKEIAELLIDLRWFIVETLQASLRYPIRKGEFYGHEDLVRYFETWKPSIRGNEIAFLTFNYDLLIEMALSSVSIDGGGYVGVDYEIAKDSHSSLQVPLLKLHGSVNWTQTEEGDILVAKTKDILGSYSGKLPPGVKEGNLSVSRAFEKLVGKSDPEPLIVPPSWNKADSHQAISPVWRRAARELADAESIYVLGYSLPETDSFFRQLYALGTVGDTILEKFWVFNPDVSRMEVFRSLLGPGARNRFRYFPFKLEEALGVVSRSIRDDLQDSDFDADIARRD